MNRKFTTMAAYDNWLLLLDFASRGLFSARIKNPSIRFQDERLRGNYKDLSEQECENMLESCDQLTHEIWDDCSAASVSALLRRALKRTDINYDMIDDIAGTLADAPVKQEYDMELMELPFGEDVCGADNLSPKIIESRLRERGVTGQSAAVREASLLTYKTMEGLPSVTLFMGPTGSGKTEIFRNLQSEFGTDSIIICDATSLTAEGWKGDVKISTVLKGLPAGCKNRAVIVFDEFDKLLEPQISGSGTNYSDMLQNELLRLCDHDKLYFGGDTDKIIDAANISVVFLGAFEKLMKKKSSESGSLGFGSPLRRTCDYGNTEITVEDLIDYGMRAELAGRIQKIVCLEPLDLETMIGIGQREVRRLARQMKREVTIAYAALNELAGVAIEKKLGARWLKSRISEMLDDLIYENPSSEAYYIGFEEPEAYEDADWYDDDELVF